MTANNSTNSHIGWFNLHRTANNSTNSHIECPNLHRTHVTANNSTNSNAVFSLVSDLKIVYNINYKSSIAIPVSRAEN